MERRSMWKNVVSRFSLEHGKRVLRRLCDFLRESLRRDYKRASLSTCFKCRFINARKRKVSYSVFYELIGLSRKIIFIHLKFLKSNFERLQIYH